MKKAILLPLAALTMSGCNIDFDSIVLVNEAPFDGNLKVVAPTYIDTYVFDQRGNIIWRAADINADGSDNHIFEASFNAQDQVTVATADFGADGTVNNRTTYIYVDGRLESHETDRNGNGVVDTIVNFIYDGSGNKIREEIVGGRIDHFDYNLDSNLLMGQRTDIDGNGTIDSSIVYAYDLNNRLEEELYDSDGDDVPDSIVTYAWNGDNRLETMTRDAGADEVPEETVVFAYDPSGGLSSRTITHPEGTDVIHYIRNAQGHLIREDVDLANDGSINHTVDYIGNHALTVHLNFHPDYHREVVK